MYVGHKKKILYTDNPSALQLNPLSYVLFEILNCIVYVCY